MTTGLLLTLAGCVFDCAGQENTNPAPITSIEEKQHRTAAEADHAPAVVSLPVDFTYAARRVTPGVVHVNATWKQPDDKGGMQDIDPFRDLFGDEFWYHFFEPFRQQGPRQATASGVIVTSDGYIITNNHVVERADEIEVVLHDRRAYPASIVGADPGTDIALIKIDEHDLVFIPYGNSDKVEVGEWVLAVGNPFNLASTVTAGIVSAKARNINILTDQEAVESFIQTDAAVNPGNSGGALVDLKGQLVGINTAIATSTGAYAGYAFAIPVNIVKKVADDLLTFGAVQRGYLGVTIRDMTSTLATQMGVDFTPGVYIDSLVHGGAAFEAGVKPGDIITAIDGSRTETSPQLQEIIAKHRPGESLTLTLIRNNTEKQVTVVLKGSSRLADSENEKSILEVLGIEVAELTAAEKRQYLIQHGLKVTRIYKGKISEHTKMREGFVITSVNNNPVGTVKDLVKYIEGHEKDGTGGGILLQGVYPGIRGVVYYGVGI